MAKKHQPAKKRKAATIAPKEEKEGAVPLGTVSVPVQLQINVTNPGLWNELVIELATLGLSEEPDKVTETSGNSRLLDPKRPISTSEEGVHLFFDPPLMGAGTYGFQLLCTYNEAAEARTAEPESEEEKKERERKQSGIEEEA